MTFQFCHYFLIAFLVITPAFCDSIPSDVPVEVDDDNDDYLLHSPNKKKGRENKILNPTIFTPAYCDSIPSDVPVEVDDDNDDYLLRSPYKKKGRESKILNPTILLVEWH